MRKTFFSLSFLLLSYLLLPAVTYPQPGDFKWSRGPARLYQVSKWDAAKRVKRIEFINNTGKLVIDFDRLPSSTHIVGEFHEGRAVIYLNREGSSVFTGYDVGFIDETGNMLIPPRFRAARNFSEGLAYVEGSEFSGFIDLQGKPVIKTDDRTRDFHEGLAAVLSSERSGSRGWGYIDRSGKLVIQKQYAFADDFSEGLAGVVVGKKFGFINQKGEMVIPPRFTPREGRYLWSGIVGTSRFSEGLAPVTTERGLDKAYGYINRKGDFVIPPQFNTAQLFSEGLALVVKWTSITNEVMRVGWIDKSGQWMVTEVQGRIPERLFPKTFMDPRGYGDWRYSEGLVPFLVYEGKPHYGYMDRSGKIVIEPREFNKVGPFVGGLARVYVKGDEGSSSDYGYIDKTGQFIWRSK